MTQLFSPPPTFELPLSKGADIYFGIVYKPIVVDGQGIPILDGQGKPQYAVANYPAGATVTVVIETSPPATPNVTIEATIVGSVATVWGDFADADTVAAGKVWRAVISYQDGLDKVLCNGKTTRYDG